MKAHISNITGIQAGALEGVDLRIFSVSDKMSWASSRKTTRIEDIAYSLMGIFDINMPLLYGEREKSFKRLQEEIMKNSDDHSLLLGPMKMSRLTPLEAYSLPLLSCFPVLPISLPSASGDKEVAFPRQTRVYVFSSFSFHTSRSRESTELRWIVP